MEKIAWSITRGYPDYLLIETSQPAVRDMTAIKSTLHGSRQSRRGLLLSTFHLTPLPDSKIHTKLDGAGKGSAARQLK